MGQVWEKSNATQFSTIIVDNNFWDKNVPLSNNMWKEVGWLSNVSLRNFVSELSLIFAQNSFALLE